MPLHKGLWFWNQNNFLGNNWLVLVFRIGGSSLGDCCWLRYRNCFDHRGIGKGILELLFFPCIYLDNQECGQIQGLSLNLVNVTFKHILLICK